MPLDPERKDRSFRILPWTGDLNNALGVPWDMRTEGDRVEILNCERLVLAATCFLPKDRASVLTANAYAVDV